MCSLIKYDMGSVIGVGLSRACGISSRFLLFIYLLLLLLFLKKEKLKLNEMNDRIWFIV